MAQFKGMASNPWHTPSPAEIAARLESHLKNGLTQPDAKDRLSALGPNALTEREQGSFCQEFFEELREPMVLMLLVTGVMALDGVQGVRIIAVGALGTSWMEVRKAIVARRHAEG